MGSLSILLGPLSFLLLTGLFSSAGLETPTATIGLPWWLRWWRVHLQCRRPRFDPSLGRSQRREWLPTPVFLPGEFHGQRSLVGYSPWGHKEQDTTEWLTLSLLPPLSPPLVWGSDAKESACGLPWWLSGEESTCQCRRLWFDSLSEKIPHALEQLSLCATTTESVL